MSCALMFVAAAAVFPQPRGLDPDTVIGPPGGPRVVFVRTSGSPAAAIRLSIPIFEREPEAGAARLIQHLALRRLRARAATFGAELEADRTLDAAVFSVRGSAADFEHLAWLVRTAVSRPVPEPTELEEARGALLAQIERAEEAPADALYAALLRRVAPLLPPPFGTRASVAALTSARLEAFWLRAFRRDSLKLVVVAPVPVEASLAAFAAVGAPAADSTPESEPPAAPPEPAPRRAETLRVWYGVAHLTSIADHALAATAARLMADTGPADPAVEAARVDLWNVRGRIALVARAAVYPGDAARVTRAVGGLLSRVQANLSAQRVSAAARSVRRDLLVAARTPWGLAEIIGQNFDATGDPAAAARLEHDLTTVDPGSLASFLARLAGQSPVRAEVRP